MADNQKEFKCTACGKIIMATKFASAKTIKCDECKQKKVSSNPQIVSEILEECKKKDTTPNTQPNTSNTKMLPCIQCGKIVEVTKFASASKVLCNECKGTDTIKKSNTPKNLKIDISKLHGMPPITEYYVIPSIINNPRLRDVQCPACGQPHMKILNILDYSIYGLIIHYQCENCYALWSISEQCNHIVKTYKQGELYDYSGDAINQLLSATDHTRLHTTIRYLLDILIQHNISIPPMDIPLYRFSKEKPIPVGFTIDKNTELIGMAKHLADMFKTATRQGESDDTIEGSRYITISDTLANKLSTKLLQLLENLDYNTND